MNDHIFQLCMFTLGGIKMAFDEVITSAVHSEATSPSASP